MILGQRLEKRPDKGLFGSYEDSNLSLGGQDSQGCAKSRAIQVNRTWAYDLLSFASDPKWIAGAQDPESLILENQNGETSLYLQIDAPVAHGRLHQRLRTQ